MNTLDLRGLGHPGFPSALVKLFRLEVLDEDELIAWLELNSEVARLEEPLEADRDFQEEEPW